MGLHSIPHQGFTLHSRHHYIPNLQSAFNVLSVWKDLRPFITPFPNSLEWHLLQVSKSNPEESTHPLTLIHFMLEVINWFHLRKQKATKNKTKQTNKQTKKTPDSFFKDILNMMWFHQGPYIYDIHEKCPIFVLLPSPLFLSVLMAPNWTRCPRPWTSKLRLPTTPSPLPIPFGILAAYRLYLVDVSITQHALVAHIFLQLN